MSKITIVLLLLVIAGMSILLQHQQRIIRDMKIYLDAGCKGHYQGIGYQEPITFVPEESPEDVTASSTGGAFNITGQKILIQCEDEREPRMTGTDNATRAVITCRMVPDDQPGFTGDR